MAVKLGNGKWAVKEDKLLAYNDNSGRFFNKEFDFDRGSIATYVAKDGLIKSAASDVPRIDFSDSTNGALLLEPQSTNLWRNSEGSDITLTSPLGTFGFYNITSSPASNSLTITAGTIVSATFIVKKADGTTPTITASGSAGDIIFRITGSSGAGQSGTLTDIGNGFYTYKLENYSVTGNNSDNRISNNSGDVVYVSLVQLEQKSFATSYIPTSGSATTRLADVCNNSGSAQDFNSEEGVLYAEIKTLSQTGTFRQINLSNGTASSRIYISKRAENNNFEFRMDNPSGSLNFSFPLETTSSFVKLAFRYGLNNFAVFINGVNKNVSSTGNVFSSGTLNNLEFSSPLNQPFFGNIKDLKVFTEAKSDEFLAALTTI